MINNKNASSDFMTNVVYLAQGASADTCGIAARIIARQTLKFLEIYPENIKNTRLFQETTRELCECLRMMREEISGTSEEILIKRDALDLLLVMSRELIFPQNKVETAPDETPADLTRYA